MASFNALPENVRTGQRDSGEGRLNDWMGGDHAYRIREEVVGLGQYGRTLTVLTRRALGTEKGFEDDENEDDLVESWTAKFIDSDCERGGFDRTSSEQTSRNFPGLMPYLRASFFHELPNALFVARTKGLILQ